MVRWTLVMNCHILDEEVAVIHEFPFWDQLRPIASKITRAKQSWRLSKSQSFFCKSMTISWQSPVEHSELSSPAYEQLHSPRAVDTLSDVTRKLLKTTKRHFGKSARHKLTNYMVWTMVCKRIPKFCQWRGWLTHFSLCFGAPTEPSSKFSSNIFRSLSQWGECDSTLGTLGSCHLDTAL